MHQALIISFALLIAGIAIGAGMLKTLLVRVVQFHFGVEPGVRNPEGRRRFRAFEWHCWKTYGCISAICSLQDFVGPPFNLFANLSGVVLPLQGCFALGVLGFGAAAVARLRNPFAY